ncbi:uncharacterized protein LOC143447079 isoform X2 [Clavelina lepadiformis]|uniref:uncharacterized protein LOC143447079 isoform X2 n=1 Tax=Clavelina lepadiformis TaxID=159417 RepID=UPI004040F044
MNIFKEQGVDLDDSLNYDSIKETYRVDFPHPNPVSDEEEFVTNSGRRVKSRPTNNFSNANNNNSNCQQELKGQLNTDNNVVGNQGNITQSLQAQLHLSLDRLSENSYDHDDLNRIKVKKNGSYHTSFKTYPVLPPQLGTVYNENASEQMSYSAGDVDHTLIGNKPMKLMNNAVIHPVIHQSLSHDSLEEAKPRPDSEEDDIHTVVVEDSLSFETEEQYLTSEEPLTASTGESSQTGRNGASYASSNPRSDRYAYLRYNPEWRGEVSQKSIQDDGIVIDFQNAPKLPPAPTNPERVHDNVSVKISSTTSLITDGGEITIHNPDLSPTRKEEALSHNPMHPPHSEMLHRNAPVRLSSNPDLMKRVNEHYEEEFRKMLESEHHPTIEEESHWSAYPPSSNRQTGINSVKRTNLKPPVSYPKSKPPLTEINAENIQNRMNNNRSNIRKINLNQAKDTPPSQNNSLNVSALASEEPPPTTMNEAKVFYPTPPKTPKADKDYIEYNKSRLGRKSNSASYLEMFAKKNRKKQQQAQIVQQRPKSETSRNKEGDPGPSKAPMPQSDEADPNLTLEEKWRLQAQKLKVAKEIKPQRTPQRQTLREVGSNKKVPKFAPEDITGNIQVLSPNRSLNSKSVSENTTNISVPGYIAQMPGSGRDSNFDNHPAFSVFHREISPRNPHRALSREEVNHYETSPDARYTNDHPKTHNTNHGDQSSPRRDQNDGGPARTVQTYHDPEQRYGTQQRRDAEMFYPVRRENFSNHQPSPIMQAYQQRLLPSRPPVHYNQNFALPPNHGIPLSPTKINGDFTFEDKPLSSGRFRRNSDSVVPSGPLKPLSNEGKHVNFAPNVRGQTPPTPGSKIPVPVGSHVGYRYPVPLPPTPPGAKRGRRDPRSMARNYENTENYNNGLFPTTPAVHPQLVPVLPPIIGVVKESPRPNDNSYDSGIVEHSPRRSLSDSEEGGGSYLLQYQRKKQKPGYKRYTLSDYKNLKKDVNLGGLGPDLTAARSKMEKVERARKYAEFIRQEHKHNTVVTARNSSQEEDTLVHSNGDDGRQRFTMATESEEKRREIKERKKRAMEYARRVPRPKLPPQASPSHDDGNHESHEKDETMTDAVDWELLKSLRERHEREKAMLAQFSPASKVT